MKVLGLGGDPTRQVSRGSLFIHSFIQGFPENISRFKYLQFWLCVVGTVTSTCWDNSCPRHGQYWTWLCLGPWHCHLYLEEKDQVATRSLPVDSWL